MTQELINGLTPLTGAGPWLGGGFDIAPGSAIKLTAYGLAAGDRICVRQVYRRQDGNATHSGEDCCITGPDGVSIVASTPYTYCGKCVCMCQAQAILRIRDPGSYLLEFSGPSFTARTVTVTGQPLAAQDVSDALLAAQCDACAFTATESINDCNGKLYGYGFGPYDTPSPEATVAINDCAGALLLRIYPTAAPGHSTPIANCGALVGYAINVPGLSAASC